MPIPAGCPLCGASAQQQTVVASRVYGDETGRAIFCCCACDVRYLYPGLSPAEEERLYAGEFESFMKNRSAADAGWDGPQQHIAANEGQRQRRMRHLKDMIGPNSRILEIGCGSGFMLYPLADAGHQCIAIEPSGLFSDYVRGRGIPCFRSIDEMRVTGGEADCFDLVLHYYVMEHLAEPVSFLKTLLGLL